MSAEYLLRFDDLCPTMDLENWDPIERSLRALRLRPIVAVVPDNRDPGLMAAPADPHFWDRVRSWRDAGWTIGLHGYQHRYLTHESGIVGLNDLSEFAGLPAPEQRVKLEAALSVFAREGISPAVWVAPAHSFDAITVAGLREVSIGVISDGLRRLPHRDRDGILWIPQQLWRFRRMPPGLWTVCCHPNSLSKEAIARFVGDLERFRGRITDVEMVARRYGDRRARAWEPLIGHSIRWAKKAKARVSALPSAPGHRGFTSS